MPVILADALIITAGALMATMAGNYVVRQVFRRIARHQSKPGQTTLRLDLPSALPGGQWIGYLERLAVFVVLTAGWKEGIAVIMAVKGLARYPELAAAGSADGERPAAERFIIGTLASVLFAAACAGAGAWLTGLTNW